MASAALWYVRLTFGISIGWRIVSTTFSRALPVLAVVAGIHRRGWLRELGRCMVFGGRRPEPTTVSKRNYGGRRQNLV